MLSRNCLVSTFYLGFLVAFPATSLHATAIVQVSADAFAVAYADGALPSQESIGPLFTTTEPSIHTLATASSAGASGETTANVTVNVDASFGLLDASIIGLLSRSTIMATDLQDAGGLVSDGQALFLDTMHVPSVPGLAQIPYMFTFSLRAGYSCGGFILCAPLEDGASLANAEFDVGSNRYFLSGNDQVTDILLLPSGQPVDIAGVLNVGIDGTNEETDRTNNSGTFAVIGIDATHSGHFYITPIIPGTEFTTDSGVLYSAPSTTPEPSSASLLAIGIVALWFFSKKRSTRSRRA
jgi:hypothetical protein